MRLDLQKLFFLSSVVSLAAANDIDDLIPTNTLESTLSTVYVTKSENPKSMVTSFYKIEDFDDSIFDKDEILKEFNNPPIGFRKIYHNETTNASGNNILLDHTLEPIYDETEFNPATDITFEEFLGTSDALSQLDSHFEKRGFWDLPITTTYPFVFNYLYCPYPNLARMQMYARYFSGPRRYILSLVEKWGETKPAWYRTDQPSVRDICNVACPPGATPYTTLTNYHPKTRTTTTATPNTTTI